MWKTVIFLIFTLIVVPIVTFQIDVPLIEIQWQAMHVILWIYGISALSVFIISTLTKNHSQVDKLWSIIPVPYVWVSAYFSGFEPRLILMASLTTLWAIRLTYNFNRRGGYSWKFWEGEEDYRWPILQAKPEFQPKWKWLIFNLIFISGYQMALIMLFTLPSIKAINSTTPIGTWDYLLSFLIIAFIIMEYIADQQQYKYQTEKHRQKSINKLDQYHAIGFTHTGLWSIIRHPNYTAEQAIWITFYFFSVIATDLWVNWSIAGCLLLVVLFKGSSDFSEGESVKKYPLYKIYQQEVGRFIPTAKRFKV